MYDFGGLWKAARPGLRDLLRLPIERVPAGLARRYTQRAFGPNPSLSLGLLVLACTALAVVVARSNLDLPAIPPRALAPLLFASICAWRVRSALFGKDSSLAELSKENPEQAFSALAKPIVLAGFLLALLDTGVRGLALGGFFDGAEVGRTVAWATALVRFLGSVLGYSAALVVLVAVLCGRRDWFAAALELFGVFILFTLSVVVARLIMIDLAPLGLLVKFVAKFFDGGDLLPAGVPTLANEIGLTFVLGGIFLALAGAAWWTAKGSFAEFVEQGDVNLVAALESQVTQTSEADAAESGGPPVR